MDRDRQIDDIVAMLDHFMGENGGHMNIRVDDNGSIHPDKTFVKSVKTQNSLDCAEGNMACRVPTLFEGLDFEESDFEDPNFEDSDSDEPTTI